MQVILVHLIVTTVVCLSVADIPWNVERNGDFTFYDNKGFGACGQNIDAASQDLVAVSPTWFTSPNSNKDPLCTGVCVKVTYKGKSVTVPVKDKCQGCNANHVDLSQPAFAKLAQPSVGHVYDAKWAFVHC